MNRPRVLLMIVFLKVFYFTGNSQTNNACNIYNGFQSSLIKPQSIIKIGEGHYFVDFGKDAFGTLALVLRSPLTDTLIVHFAEKTVTPNTVDRKPEGSIRYQKVQLTDVLVNKEYIVKFKPDKRNTNPPAIALPDSFGVIMPFRYCELENLKVPIDDITIGQKTYNVKFNDNASDFICSDTVINKVWDLCKYTIKATSFCGLYVDGDRERTPYEADAFINQLSHYCVDNEYEMARKTNEYFINHPSWPTEWILHTVLLFYYDFLYTGDIKAISENYEALKHKTLMDLEREDGLISSKPEKVTGEVMKSLGFKNTSQRIRDIVDWPPAQSETTWKLATDEGERDGYDMVEINTVVNSFHYINLKLMAEIAGYLGKKDDSVAFYKKSILVKDAMNQKLIDKSKGIYVDGENSKHSSLHANMFPLAFGLVPDEYLKTVISFIKTRGMACSVYGAQYLLEGLYAQGEADYALGLMASTSDRGWWNMIKAGSTLTLEAWDMKYKPNSDWNHAWGTAPANIITRCMWGIVPGQAGFAKVQIKPQLGSLTYSKIKVPTIKGAIIAEFKMTNKKQKLFVIELPKEMKGYLVLSKDDKLKILVNGKAVKTNNGSIPLNSGLNRIEVK
jgi:alpha-L-rhamnosidase